MTLPMGSPHTSITEIDASAPNKTTPSGIPAGVVGTSVKGPAFIPITVANGTDFQSTFGAPTTECTNGPLGALEWLKNAQALTYLKVLGAGDGTKRTSGGNNSGKVNNAGFVVGDNQPDVNGYLTTNPYAVAGGDAGRCHFLGAYMSQSAGSTIFSDAGLVQGANIASPIIRGVILAASGVVPMLSSSWNADSSAPDATTPGTFTSHKGSITGSAILSSSISNGVQEFVMLLNGHMGTDPHYSNVITASMDPTANNYFGTIFNKDPLKIQQAGYVLYTSYNVSPAYATVTGSGLMSSSFGADAGTGAYAGIEPSIFLTYGSATRNSGSATIPNFENFEDRFQAGKSPWIISQKFGGHSVNLFQLVLRDDGEKPTKAIKISIENLKNSKSSLNKYGTFDLLVRSLEDNDLHRVVYEKFSGLSLDQGSPHYIAKVIGDKNTFYNFDSTEESQRLIEEGQYDGSSNYIRVTMSSEVENSEVNEEALPVGFRGYYHLNTSGSAPLVGNVDHSILLFDDVLNRAVQPPIPFREAIYRGTRASRALYWGVQFEQKISLTEPNSSTLVNNTITNLSKYFPTFQDTWQNVVVGENEGMADTTANGILDADRFNNNLFSLENINVTTGSSGLALSTTAANWRYVRNGAITVDPVAHTRAFKVQDLNDNNNSILFKFSLFVQGGFDGVRIFDYDTANLTNQAIQEEMANTNRGLTSGPTVCAYTKALDIMKDISEVDIKVLAFPGIRNSYVTDQIIEAVGTDRFDCVYPMDVEEYSVNDTLTSTMSETVSVTNTAGEFRNRGVDSNFVSAYFPDMNVINPLTNTPVRVPPSVSVLGAISRSDAISKEWFSVSGYNRGALISAESAVIPLSKADLDTLFDAGINPIASFGGSNGPVIWGQKTLQAEHSSLDRLNVRRLLIAVRRRVKAVSNQIIFEQNLDATLARFNKLVQPIMQEVQAGEGVSWYSVKIDASLTTQADIQNNTIRGKIWLKPVGSYETISLDFNLNNQAGG